MAPCFSSTLRALEMVAVDRLFPIRARASSCSAWVWQVSRFQMRARDAPPRPSCRHAFLLAVFAARELAGGSTPYRLQVPRPYLFALRGSSAGLTYLISNGPVP